ncbi:hypothetical protein [Lacticaseibacillus sp. N501-2]|uniref:hypothetical protein n=1 Tax=Lacticaseibacillus salsurae TaxID=3367729 RepID=UPI0038B2843F
MTKTYKLTPTEAAVIGLMRRGANVDLTIVHADLAPETNAQAREWLQPIAEATGARIEHVNFKDSRWWRIRVEVTTRTTIAATVFPISKKRPDHA